MTALKRKMKALGEDSCFASNKSSYDAKAMVQGIRANGDTKIITCIRYATEKLKHIQ